MPEFSPDTQFMRRAQLRGQLRRALEALDDDRLADEDAFAVTHNIAAGILTTIETVDRAPALASARTA
jgi:hypothetical protein